MESKRAIKMKSYFLGAFLSLAQLGLLFIVSYGFLNIFNVSFQMDISLDWWVMVGIVVVCIIHLISHIYIFSKTS